MFLKQFLSLQFECRSRAAAEAQRYAARVIIVLGRLKDRMALLSSKGRALGPALIVIICLLGLWLGSHLQFWLGLIVFLVAAAGLVVMSHRDLRPTEQAQRFRWKHIREYGKLRYVGRQVLSGWPLLLFFLAIDLSGSYNSGEPWNPRWFATLFGLWVVGIVLLSLGWWYWQERKYGNVS